MKKTIITISLLIGIPVFAGTLYEYYIQRQYYFPPILERAEEYEMIFPDKYKGTYEQNVKFLNYLAGGAIGGFTSRGYPTNFLTVATSGPMTIGGDIRVLATTTNAQRAYVSICNDGTATAYLSLNDDKPLTRSGGGIILNSSVFLPVNTCYYVKPENMYEGSIRASSTAVSSGFTIFEATTNDK